MIRWYLLLSITALFREPKAREDLPTLIRWYILMQVWEGRSSDWFRPTRHISGFNVPLWGDYVEFYVSGSDLSELWLNSKSK
jgi:hypothetical protein